MGEFFEHFWDDIQRAKEKGYKFPLIYWLVAADYERTYWEFQYLKGALAALGLLHNSSKRVDPGFLEIGGGPEGRPVTAIIKTKSANDYRRLAMESPMGIIGCEASQLDLESYYRLIERSAPQKAWLYLSGTMEGSLGWYPALAQSWYGGIVESDGTRCKAFALPSWSNHHLFPGGEDDPEILRLRRELSEERYLERIEGVPCPPSGLVFKEFRPDLHIRNVEYCPDVPVHVWIDPGYGHPGAVEVVQVIDGVVTVIDEVFEQGIIDEEFIAICQNKPWWKDVKFGVVDIYGAQHHGRTPIADVWQAKTGLVLRYHKMRSINDGTERLKSFLKPDPLTREPRIVFSPRCKGVLSEFGAGPSPIDGQTKVYKWKTDKDGNIIGDTPDDKNNDGIKAIIYGLVDNFGYVTTDAGKVVHIQRWARDRNRFLTPVSTGAVIGNT